MEKNRNVAVYSLNNIIWILDKKNCKVNAYISINGNTSIKDVNTNRTFIMTGNDLTDKAKSIYCLSNENANLWDLEVGNLAEFTEYLLIGSSLSNVLNEYYSNVREISGAKADVSFKDIQLAKKDVIAKGSFTDKFVDKLEISRIGKDIEMGASLVLHNKEKEIQRLIELETY